LFGLAADRQPLGSSDPVLCGVSAVELYTGGLWSDAQLEVLTAAPRLLTAELFAVGLRWTHRPRQGMQGLWHSELQVGIDLTETRTSPRPTEQANVLIVAIDLASGPARNSDTVLLKVIGIEDFIAKRAKCCLMHGAPTGECATQLQALMELGQDGVGGGLRAGYLERRVASETDGEIVPELSSSGQSGTRFSAPRMTTLTCMQMIIDAWHDRRGLSADRQGPSNRSDSLDDRDPIGQRRNDRREQVRRSCLETDNVVPFCADVPVSLDWQ
jgi:hypothetical protein